MKFYHLADLHFGKTIYGRLMLEDQRDWAEKFLKICEKEKPDAVLIAGDVYDRSDPSGDAVELLDWFLTSLAELGIPVFSIAGNHDNGKRLSFGHSLLAKQNIHIVGKLSTEIEHYTMDDPDGYGPVTIWMLPYTYPEWFNSRDDWADIRTYNDTIRKLIELQDIDKAQRNIIISHQNVTANGQEAERSGSESMVGGVGQVDYSVYDAFDYVALGHIHSSYHVGREEVRYAGTPLCYHLSETRQKDKGPVEVVLNAKGVAPKMQTVKIPPLHKMRYIVDTKENVYKLLKDDSGRGEYVGITITDERITPEVSSYLRGLLSNRGSVLMELLTSLNEFGGGSASASREDIESKPIEELFAAFYVDQNGGMSPKDDEVNAMKYVGELIRNTALDDQNDLERAAQDLLNYVKNGGENE